MIEQWKIYFDYHNRMIILLLKKRINRDKCSFATKQRCSGSSLSMRSFAIKEAPSPLPALYATLVMNVLAFYSESDRTQARLWTGLSLHCQRRPASAWEGS